MTRHRDHGVAVVRHRDHSKGRFTTRCVARADQDPDLSKDGDLQTALGQLRFDRFSQASELLDSRALRFDLRNLHWQVHPVRRSAHPQLVEEIHAEDSVSSRVATAENLETTATRPELVRISIGSDPANVNVIVFEPAVQCHPCDRQRRSSRECQVDTPLTHPDTRCNRSASGDATVWLTSALAPISPTYCCGAGACHATITGPKKAASLWSAISRSRRTGEEDQKRRSVSDCPSRLPWSASR